MENVAQTDEDADWIDQNLKRHYKQTKKVKLEMLHAMDEFILAYVNTITRSSISYDIIRVILLFYVYDLSQYEYIAIFTSKEQEYIDDGYLSAFNLTDNLSSKTTYFETTKRYDIQSDLTRLFREIYGTTFRLFSLNKFPQFIRNNLFPKYSKLISNTMSLHVLFRIESTKKADYDISASLIELDEHKYLSTNHTNEFDRCELLQSPVHGLIVLGGMSTAKVQVLNWNTETTSFEWDTSRIKRMNVSRCNHKAVILDDNSKILVCGGNTPTYTGEIYNFHTNKWKNIKKMNEDHSCHGIYYDKNRNFVYSLASYNGHKKCERYDLHKNMWYYLPDLNHKHRWHPTVKMMDNNSVLMITGDFYKYNKDTHNWGYSEYLDLRDNTFRLWRVMDRDICKALDFSDEEYSQKYMRGLWLL